MIRLIQLQNGGTRRVALVEEPHLRLLSSRCASVYDLASAALRERVSLAAVAQREAGGEMLDYDAVYTGASPWRLLLPVDHPGDPARCLVSGTGLTHLGSAKDRQAMHRGAAVDETDSMRMFRWGVERGRPEAGEVGVAPEWFYKGSGTILRAHGEPIDRPGYAEDGGEEAEVAGIYLIDDTGAPRRLGMAAGNEFSDHKFEKRNYLNLAGSKLRLCSIGPELVVDPDFASVPGTVTLLRAGSPLWSNPIATGESEMSHSLANLEHHHFKFEAHRRPGDLHVHYYGAHSLSFGAAIELQDGDEMIVHFPSFGRALRNPLRVLPAAHRAVRATPL